MAERPSAGSEVGASAPGTTPVPEIRRILITSAWFGGLVTLALGLYLGWLWALGFIAGAVLGLVNLVLLTALIRQIVTLEKRKKARIAALLAVKVPIVYGGLAALILWSTAPPLSIVSGFSLVLVVIVLKAAGRALLASGLFGQIGRG